ncbi:NUDIX domain-containing protein [Tumebacillus flagellatus]|uniref:Nudix hydrolase domain-containing protein n=1 Tax=Tumebacillus flagellatus TaxID=1157490 RepID=A0A074M6M0_9BACL|nr:NUDIX hydrolase [Tumebacillus flagellatus]KEO81607.1 hypothetical protein EL26_19725 [Tumebacillus flagellatus]
MTFTSSRPRACGVLLRGSNILMVHLKTKTADFWTLPGGGLEPGETPEEAVVREVREETGLVTRAVRFLYETTYSQGPEFCFLLEEAGLPGASAVLGHDPEFAPDEQALDGLAWRPLSEVRDDKQIRQVLRHLE